MTILDAVAQLRAAIGPSWPHAKTVPSPLVKDLCTALWDAGEHPQVGRMTALVGLDKRAMEGGFAVWRADRDRADDRPGRFAVSRLREARGDDAHRL
jgi:hypothetical protein